MEVQIHTTTDKPPVNIMSNDSIQFIYFSETSDSEEDIGTYKGRYVEEDDDINFFRDLVPDSIDCLETMVFSTTDLDTLKEKEKTLREKEEGKYFCSKITNPILYRQITVEVAPYIAADKLKMRMYM